MYTNITKITQLADKKYRLKNRVRNFTDETTAVKAGKVSVKLQVSGY